MLVGRASRTTEQDVGRTRPLPQIGAGTKMFVSHHGMMNPISIDIYGKKNQPGT